MVFSLIKLALLGVAFGVDLVVGTSPEDYFVDAVDKGTYEGWLQGRGTAYERNTFMPASGEANKGVALFWTIHGDDGDDPTVDETVAVSRMSGTKPWIQFAVAVQATGWLGFGISEAGGMRGSDMVIWDSEDPTKVRDMYLIEGRTPLDDDCKHWELLEVTFSDGWIILEVARNLDTGDPQDRPIFDDSPRFGPGNRLISAWGDGAYGNHGTNAARREVRLFEQEMDAAITVQAIHQQLNATADGFVSVLAREYTIPTDETTYHTTCYTYQDLLDQASGLIEGQSVTLVGIAPVMTPKTKMYFITSQPTDQ